MPRTPDDLIDLSMEALYAQAERYLRKARESKTGLSTFEVDSLTRILGECRQLEKFLRDPFGDDRPKKKRLESLADDELDGEIVKLGGQVS